MMKKEAVRISAFDDNRWRHIGGTAGGVPAGDGAGAATGGRGLDHVSGRTPPNTQSLWVHSGQQFLQLRLSHHRHVPNSMGM